MILLLNEFYITCSHVLDENSMFPRYWLPIQWWRGIPNGSQHGAVEAFNYENYKIRKDNEWVIKYTSNYRGKNILEDLILQLRDK